MPLLGRTVQGQVTILINFTSVKFYTLTLIAIVNNFGPLVTTLLAFVCLSEKITYGTIIALMVSFLGALVMILGGKDDSVVEEGSSVFGFVCLILNPVFVAIGTIMMRQMKKLNESVVSCYMNFASVLVLGPLVYAMGHDLSICWSFSVYDWLWVVGLSGSSICSQTFRYKALQSEKASALQPYNFLNPVWQLIADILIFSASFTNMQMLGVGIVVMVYVVELFHYYCFGRHATKEEVQVK